MRFMKRCLLLAVLLHAIDSGAITWEFDKAGDDQGWRARESIASMAFERPPLRSEVRDGVWRVYPASLEAARNPSVELVSPPIGHDSALFDRLIVRLRLVHTQPVVGRASLVWTNPFNASTPGTTAPAGHLPAAADMQGFGTGHTQTFTTEWQDVIFRDLRSRIVRVPTVQGEEALQILWEGELEDLRLHLEFCETSQGRPSSWARRKHR